MEFRDVWPNLLVFAKVVFFRVMNNDVEEVAPQTQRKKIEFKQIPGIRPINKFYEIKFINDHPSDFRRCLACKKEIKCSNSNTSGLHKHRENCLKRGPIDNVATSALKFPKVSTKHGKGLNQVAKLVYEDNFPISKAGNSRL